MLSLNWMRDHMKIILVVTIGAFLALIFFQWGMNFTGMSHGGVSYAVKINGKEIPTDNFQRQLSANQEDAMGNNKKELSQQEKDQIYKNTVDDFIKEVLIMQTADDLGVTASAPEILREVRSNPTFVKNGKFDLNTYNKIVRDPRSATKLIQLEQSYRYRIIRNKILSYLTSGAVITTEDLKMYYLQTMGMIKTKHIFIKPAEFVSASDAKKEYKDNIDKYTDKEGVQIQNLLIKLPANPTDAEIDEAIDSASNILAELNAGLISYDNAVYKYSDDRQSAVQDSGIIYQYFTREDNPFKIKLTEEDLQKAYNKADTILEKLKSGADFTKLAKKYSEGPSRVRGGDLGWITRGKMVSSFENALYRLKKVGDLSDIVQTKFGFHIILLTGIDGEKRRASHILIIPHLKENPVIDKAFELKVGQIGGPVRSPLGIHLIKLIDKKEARVLNFDEVKDRIKSTLVNDTEVELAKNTISQIYIKLKNDKKDFDSLAREYSNGKTAAIGGDLPYFRPGLIASYNYPDYDTETIDILQKEIGYAFVSRGRIFYTLDPSIKDEIFDLKPNEISDTIDAQNGFHIFQIIRRKPFNEDEFKEVKNDLVKELTNKKRQEIFNLWFLKEKDDASIKYHPSVKKRLEEIAKNKSYEN